MQKNRTILRSYARILSSLMRTCNLLYASTRALGSVLVYSCYFLDNGDRTTTNHCNGNIRDNISLRFRSLYIFWKEIRDKPLPVDISSLPQISVNRTSEIPRRFCYLQMARGLFFLIKRIVEANLRQELLSESLYLHTHTQTLLSTVAKKLVYIS